MKGAPLLRKKRRRQMHFQTQPVAMPTRPKSSDFVISFSRHAHEQSHRFGRGTFMAGQCGLAPAA